MQHVNSERVRVGQSGAEWSRVCAKCEHAQISNFMCDGCRVWEQYKHCAICSAVEASDADGPLKQPARTIRACAQIHITAASEAAELCYSMQAQRFHRVSQQGTDFQISYAMGAEWEQCYTQCGGSLRVTRRVHVVCV